jgi:hypothetical protein
MKSILTAPVALLLAIPAAASAAVVPVTSRSGRRVGVRRSV